MTNKEERQKGFYWVKRFEDDEWFPASMDKIACHGELFSTPDFVGLSADFHAIGPRIEPPEEGKSDASTRQD